MAPSRISMFKVTHKKKKNKQRCFKKFTEGIERYFFCKKKYLKSTNSCRNTYFPWTFWRPLMFWKTQSSHSKRGRKVQTAPMFSVIFSYINQGKICFKMELYFWFEKEKGCDSFFNETRNNLNLHSVSYLMTEKKR